MSTCKAVVENRPSDKRRLAELFFVTWDGRVQIADFVQDELVFVGVLCRTLERESILRRVNGAFLEILVEVVQRSVSC